MLETLYQTVDAGHSTPDSGCRSLSIRQGMQETLLQTGDTGDSIRQLMQEILSDSGCRRLYQTAYAGDSIRQRMQETLSDRG